MKHKYLTPNLCHFLCNILIQPHFDYASSARYTHLSKKLKNKIQSSQNKCIRFFLLLDKSLVGLALRNKTSDERTASLKIFNITKFKVKWYLNFKIKKKLSLLFLVSPIAFYDSYYSYDYCYKYFNYCFLV